MRNGKRILKNAAFEIASYGARSASLFLVPLLLARLAGAELLGQYVTVFSLASVFIFLAAFGLPRLLMREVSRVRDSKPEVNQLINASLGIVIILALLTIFLMYLIGVWMEYSALMMNALIFAGFALAFESLANIFAAAFRGSEEMEWSWLVRMVAEVAYVSLVFIVIMVDIRTDWIMAAFMLSRLTSMSVGAGLYRRRFGRIGLLVDLSLWRKLIKLSFPFAINTAVTLVRGRLGVLILAFLSGSVAVAMLEVASSLTVRINVLGRSVNDAFYPFLSSQYVKDEHSLPKYTAKGIQFLLIPSMLIATVIWVFGHDIILLLYGDAFVLAVPGLQLLALVIPLRFITYSLGTALTASDRQAQRATAVTVAAVSNVALNFSLIPTFQMMGAIYAILLTEIILFGLTVWYLRIEISDMIAWRPFVAPVFGSMMIISSSVLFNTLNVWYLLMLSTLLYAVIILGVDHATIRPILVMTRKRL